MCIDKMAKKNLACKIKQQKKYYYITKSTDQIIPNTINAHKFNEQMNGSEWLQVWKDIHCTLKMCHLHIHYSFYVYCNVCIIIIQRKIGICTYVQLPSHKGTLKERKN